jgi:release factor glutamine methyltransferase
VIVTTSPAPFPAWSGQLDEDSLALWHELMEEVKHELQALPDKPEETADATVRSLWLLAAGEPVSARLATVRSLPSLGADQRDRLRSLVRQRLSGTPLAHLTERQSFMDVEMLAGPAALIPRKETELLARAAASLLRRLAGARAPVVVVDLCTGSGNLAGALALAEARAIVYASDVSEDAVALARRNMAYLGLENRVTLRVGDLVAPFDVDGLRGEVDLLTCNPPYVSTGRMAKMPTEIVGHEPALAFDGGPFGVRILNRLIHEAPRLLRARGWLAFEVGLGQGPAVEQRLLKSGDYVQVDRVMDAAGHVRALLAQRRSEP